MKFPKISFRKKKSHWPLFVAVPLVLILALYLTLEIFGGPILTALYGDKFPPYKISLADIDFGFANGEVVLDRIEILRKSGTRIALIDKFYFVPRLIDQKVHFKAVGMSDAHFDVSTSDIPENVKKKSEPLAIKPNFGNIVIKNIQLRILGVKGLDGDEHLTLRKINGDVKCGGEELCLKNSFVVSGYPIKSSKVLIDGTSDVRTTKMLDVRGTAMNIELSVFNSILTKSSPVIAETGKVDLYTQLKLHGPSGSGYLKFFVEGLELEKMKDTKAGFLSKVAGSILSDRKIAQFDLLVPVTVKKNVFSLEEFDIKKEFMRIYSGKHLSRGFQ